MHEFETVWEEAVTVVESWNLHGWSEGQEHAVRIPGVPAKT